MDTGDWSGNQKQRGGSPKKILDAHVDYLLDELAKTPELTLVQMVELVEQKFDVTVNRETVRRALDARSFTVKKLHRDVVNRNNPINKQKRSDYVIKFYAALANNKRVFYLDKTNFNLWCLRGRGWGVRGRRAVQNGVASKGKNIHVIAMISSTGLAYQESQFGSFTAELANEFIRHFLRHIRTTTSLDEIVVVLDNAPCHTSTKDVFEKEEFQDAEMLKLGPYFTTLNPIENVFSAYKSAVKRFLTRQRPAILRVPENTTIIEHRTRYLELAADPLFAKVVTPDLCNRAFCQSLHHYQRALRFEDREVGM
ncbi:hypothetical protein PC129_g17754 [Phytophthora cactorum]|uniref:Tc1-like transposase DDE domain-containing protein n=1 Tax=Phytophthora cactorum TaxID=29920 RepID=A0A8T1AZJ4_9STRA|nr:hypothetical protein Pcac1_g11474 [Phytophthora cactorum]KAG2803783.1 hypothetical protein PC112_g19024 [Phytophthora cactorum]KAG2804687.1 hypothetical protein PC111_g18147 [Phytophthora cactorum]KAG2841438.1 hypothetical protein PC113_g19035 [Phytophthora cactorum]KAG2893381.1 hypothetical protein PC115_g18489 [Phytophthora cactorum]